MAIAIAVVFSSCSSKSDYLMEENISPELIFTATMESDSSRATYNETNSCASWEVNDQISINGIAYSAQSAGVSSTFKASQEGQNATGSQFNAYFPFELYNGSEASLPKCIHQTWEEGKFNMPMYATSSSKSLEFKNLCGVLKIIIKSEKVAQVRSITVSSSNLATSGKFTVSGNAAVLSQPNTKDNTTTIIYDQVVTTSSNGTVFYVAIPAQTYQELSIEVFDGQQSRVMTTTSNVDITIERNVIYPISFADNTGTTHPFIVMGGKKWSTMNFGASTIATSPETCFGDYYQWGSLNKLYTHKEWNSAIPEWTFTWAPGVDEYEGFCKNYLEYKDPDSSITTLPFERDVVRQEWQGQWRIPTNEDFNNLAKACTGNILSAIPVDLNSSQPEGNIYWLSSTQTHLSEYLGIEGALFVDKENPYKRLFLPAASCITVIYTVTPITIYYWSASIDISSIDISKNEYWPYNLLVNNNVMYLDHTNRYTGITIRPVAD